MADASPQPKLSSSSEANLQYQSGTELKSKGQTDAALTWFRRAVISDPIFFAAHMEIGYLCREKAKSDKMFLRYAYEAFRNAARLDLTHAEAHNQYIMAGQQMGAMDSLHYEYSEWAKKFPENELIQQSNKNIVTLSMAMMPQKVGTGETQASVTIRKFILIASLVSLLAGIGVMLAPTFLLKAGKIQKTQVAGFVKLGLLVEAIGMAGFFVRAKIN